MSHDNKHWAKGKSGRMPCCSSGWCCCWCCAWVCDSQLMTCLSFAWQWHNVIWSTKLQKTAVAILFEVCMCPPEVLRRLRVLHHQMTSCMNKHVHHCLLWPPQTCQMLRHTTWIEKIGCSSKLCVSKQQCPETTRDKNTQQNRGIFTMACSQMIDCERRDNKSVALLVQFFNPAEADHANNNDIHWSDICHVSTQMNNLTCVVMHTKQDRETLHSAIVGQSTWVSLVQFIVVFFFCLEERSCLAEFFSAFVSVGTFSTFGFIHPAFHVAHEVNFGDPFIPSLTFGWCQQQFMSSRQIVCFLNTVFFFLPRRVSDDIERSCCAPFSQISGSSGDAECLRCRVDATTGVVKKQTTTFARFNPCFRMSDISEALVQSELSTNSWCTCRKTHIEHPSQQW